MTNSTLNPKVDEYLSKAQKWQEEMKKLRMILPADRGIQVGCSLLHLSEK